MAETEKKSAAVNNRSTEKALAIMELLAQSREPMRLRDISQALQLNASTTLRFLTSLQNCEYVAQEADTARYYLTYKICRIANQLNSKMELQTITHPYLIALSQQFHEALCVSVERDMTMVYIDVATGPDQTLMSMQHIGNVSPMHSTGNGKLRLLTYSEEQIDKLIQTKGLPKFTENTITTKQGLLAELKQVREEGFAYDNEECEIGSRCVACPIRDYTGVIIAGISVTGPATRMTAERVEQEIKPRLAAAAEAISQALGYKE